VDDREPLPSELAAIEVEWPLIAAELAELDREITRLSLHDLLDQVQVRRARRLARRTLRERTPSRLAGRGEAA
jgi:hypothetical protein